MEKWIAWLFERPATWLSVIGVGGLSAWWLMRSGWFVISDFQKLAEPAAGIVGGTALAMSVTLILIDVIKCVRALIQKWWEARTKHNREADQLKADRERLINDLSFLDTDQLLKVHTALLFPMGRVAFRGIKGEFDLFDRGYFRLENRVNQLHPALLADKDASLAAVRVQLRNVGVSDEKQKIIEAQFQRVLPAPPP